MIPAGLTVFSLMGTSPAVLSPRDELDKVGGELAEPATRCELPPKPQKNGFLIGTNPSPKLQSLRSWKNGVV